MNTQSDQFPIWRALRRNTSGFVIFGVLTLFLTMLKFVSPLYMLQIYNRVLPTQNEETLIALSTMFAALLLLYGFIEFARTRVLNLFARYVDTELAGVSFSSVFRSHVSGQAPEGASRGSQGLTDLNTIRRFWANGGVGSYFDALFSPILIGALYFIHPTLFYLGLAGAIIIFSIALITEFASRSAMRNSAEAEATSNRLSETSLQNSEVVTALGMLSRLKDRWMNVHDQATEVTSGSGSLVGAFVAFARTVRLLLQIAVLGIGAWLHLNDPSVMSAGGIVAASIILGQGLNPIDQSIQSWRQFVGARQASGRLGKLVASLPPEGQQTRLPRPAATLEARGLNLMVPGQRRPLYTGVNFKLNAGDVMVVIGGSGRGKSSLLRVLAGIWPAGGGSVTLGGVELANWHSDDRGQHIGYLPQDVQLLSGTIRDNIARLDQAEDNEVIAAAQSAGCHDLILGLPMAYDTPIGGQHSAGSNAINLSGGQRQRVGLARALFRRPPLVLLDEPNSNLDDLGLAELSAAVKRESEAGHIVVLVTHSTSLIQLSNRLMVLRENDVVYGATAKVLAEVSKGTGSAAAKSSPTPQPSTNPQQQQMAFQSAVEAGGTNGTAPAGTSPGQDPAAIKLSARERRRLAKQDADDADEV